MRAGQLDAILTIAYRDVLKFMRDRVRIVASFVFPALFVAVLGGSLQANLGEDTGFNLLTFTFTGILAQTLFQSAALGLISMIEDRENDFSQEIFVAPISRYAIVFGKILGESSVAMAQGLGLIVLALVIGVPMSLRQGLSLIPVGLAAALLGGSFGMIVLSRISSQRAAQQLFPFVFLPQFFLAGVFSPINVLPLPLEILSRISPLRYAVDLVRGVYYAGTEESSRVVLASVGVNALIAGALFALFLVGGTAVFVRGERNR
jgi:ABC-2 type transport system permease protein